MPTLAKLMAMPPPMVPAPSTAARLISRGFASAGMFAGLLASRSAKKICRSAFDFVWTRPVPEMRRVRASSASSIGSSIASRSACTAAGGARGPPTPRLADFATSSSKLVPLALNAAIFSSRSRASVSGRFSAIARRTNATPAADRIAVEQLVDQAAGAAPCRRRSDRRTKSSPPQPRLPPAAAAAACRRRPESGRA